MKHCRCEFDFELLVSNVLEEWDCGCSRLFCNYFHCFCITFTTTMLATGLGQFNKF